MIARIKPGGALRGVVRVPSDKSISHRAVLFAAMAEGTSHLSGVLDSGDVRSTIAAVSALGADVLVTGRRAEGLELRIRGWGARGPAQPPAPLDCGNSGTTARLLMGVLAGWPLEVTLIGDESLSARPMRRVTDPLTTMGATITTTPSGTLPVTIRGGALRRLAYASPVASAQVKTAVLLAGLRADGTTSVAEPAQSRDHTERLLPMFGVPVVRDRTRLTASVAGPAVPCAADVQVPADPSSTAFLAVAAVIVSGSSVHLPDISLNPTRTGFLRVLERMGAHISAEPSLSIGAEPVGTLHASSGLLTATTITADEVPALIDEVPLLALAAARAWGTTRFEGVGELRVKESDRLEAVRSALEAFGVPVAAGKDWLEVTGPARLAGAVISSLGDHRLAMSWAVAGLVADGVTVVERFEAAEVSYPAFAGDLRDLGADVSTA
jgi:3-phosphoshikimate 1-carboxyvinyltransferase